VYVVSITQHNVTVPGPSEIKVFEQDRAHFTYKCKATVSHRIWMILPW